MMNIINQIIKKIKDFFEYWLGTSPSLEEVCKPDFKIIIPIIRRTMPTIIAHDIVGVQPMTGPTSKIFSLPPKYSGPQQDIEDKETNS